MVDHDRVTDLNKHITDIERAFLESAIEKSRDQKGAAKILGVDNLSLAKRLASATKKRSKAALAGNARVQARQRKARA